MKPKQHELSIVGDVFNLAQDWVKQPTDRATTKIRAVDLPGPKPPENLKAHEQEEMPLKEINQ